MSRYSLNIYDPETLEIVNTLETNGLLFGQFMDIAASVDELKGKDTGETLEFMIGIMQKVFPSATRDELMNANGEDMMSIFESVCALGQKNGILKTNGKAHSKN